MSSEGAELFAMALSLDVDGTPDHDVVAALVDAAQCRATTLMSACAFAASLARDLPYDPASDRALDLLSRAAQAAVHRSGMTPAEDRAILLGQIVESSGRSALAPGAVASRTAEVDADLEKLRPPDETEEPAAS